MKKIKITKESIAILLVLIVSAVLNFANLSIEGYANEYYAAGVKSMTMSLKNFFFVSFDPAGFVSIDKPPLGFMIQAISAKIFGYSGVSILLPQALAGVLSVWVIYRIVKRSFGSIAGIISALCLAVTPIFVADSRNNTIDNLLVLTLLLACWALSVAAEKGKLKYLILSLFLVGVGFNIKMLQAYMIVPAIYITYLLASSISIKKRLGHLVIGTVVLLITSLSWAFIVGLVPAANRPFVGSSTNNTVMELIVGWNGLSRLGLGSNSSMPGGNRQMNSNVEFAKGAPDGTSGAAGNQNDQNTPPQNQNTPPQDGYRSDRMHGEPPSGTMGGQGGFGQGNGSGQTGNMGGAQGAGITRLFSNNSLSDQIVWMLPLAILGIIAAAIKEKLRVVLDNRKKQAIVLWAAWLIPVFLYFSFTTGLFHPYYLTMLAPPIAALAGIGIASMWEMYKEGGWKSWLLPGSLIVSGAVQLLILSYYYNTSVITKYLIIAVAVLCFGASIFLGILNFKKNDNIKVKKPLVAIALAGILATPAVWSGTTMFYKISGTFPSAGLSLITGNGQGMGGKFGSSSSSDTSIQKLVAYLKANCTTEKYLVAVQSATGTASSVIIQTGESVMTLGGFSGSDKIITLDQFKQLVSEGQLRYVITGGQGGSSEIMTWVKENGTLVSQSEWSGSETSSTQTSDSSSSQNSGKGGMDRGNQSIELYDLKAQ
ncbi:MAG: glycosyltransferase family 39 protein [Clostridiaceae bacterium]